MKLISEHLGEIIVALAGVALLVTAVVIFKDDLGGFFNGIVDKLTSIGNNILNNMDVVNANGTTVVKP